MRKMIYGVSATACLGALYLGGCTNLLPTIPIALDLGAAGVSNFAVEAGVPEQAKANFNGAPPDVQAGRGTIAIDPSSITLQPTDNGGGKIRLVNQQPTGQCTIACLAALVPAATCADVCDDGEVHVTVWVGTSAAITADCTDGDEYQLVVVLDDAGNATSVTANPSTLTQTTIDLVNSGVFSLCIEVLSPVDGTVIIDELTLNLGL